MLKGLSSLLCNNQCAAAGDGGNGIGDYGEVSGIGAFKAVQIAFALNQFHSISKSNAIYKESKGLRSIIHVEACVLKLAALCESVHSCNREEHPAGKARGNRNARAASVAGSFLGAV